MWSIIRNDNEHTRMVLKTISSNTKFSAGIFCFAKFLIRFAYDFDGNLSNVKTALNFTSLHGGLHKSEIG